MFNAISQELTMITVMGATGHTGHQIATALLAAGERVRAVGRSAQRLEALAKAGAEIFTGDVADAAFLTRAFEGADAVYTMLATDPQTPDYAAEQQRKGEAIVQALRASGVRHAVCLSSIGADGGERRGVVGTLHAQEQRLKALEGSVNLHLLRPASFFENFEAQLPAVEHEGVLADTVTPDLPVPMVATRDIAAAAVRALRSRDWAGTVVQELLGPRDMSHAEAAQILGRRLDKPDAAYVQVDGGAMAQALEQAGLSNEFATLVVEMNDAINEQRLQPRAGRTAENTTPTTFEDVAAQMVAAYRARA